MGSGMMPYTPTKTGDALIQGGLAELERICDSVLDEVGGDGQYDNAFHDGWGVGELQLAIRLIKSNIKLEARQREGPK